MPRRYKESTGQLLCIFRKTSNTNNCKLVYTHLYLSLIAKRSSICIQIQYTNTTKKSVMYLGLQLLVICSAITLHRVS